MRPAFPRKRGTMASRENPMGGPELTDCVAAAIAESARVGAKYNLGFFNPLSAPP